MSNLFFDEVQTNDSIKLEAHTDLTITHPNFPALKMLKNFLAFPEDIRIFEVSNVSEIVEARYSSEVHTMSNDEILKSMPNIAPPFPRIWLEYSYTQVFRKDFAISKYKSFARRKVLSKYELDELYKKVEALPTNTRSTFIREGLYIESKKIAHGWIIRGFGFVKINNRILMYEMSTSASIDGSPSGLTRIVVFTETSGTEEKIYLSGSLYKFFHSIALMHCKNIVTEEVGSKSETVKKRHHRSKGTRHHLLKIIPMKKVKVYQEKGASSLSKGDVSFHIRRGHFKTYSPEAPLFGVHSGTYWWESHTAGKAEVGTVTKNYQINAPGE